MNALNTIEDTINSSPLFLVTNKDYENESKSLLDNLFPLDGFSHNDVISYQIDYCHLVAYFKNGEHTGLIRQHSFVAYKGRKECPDAILFKNEHNSHIEMILDNSGDCNGRLCLTKIKELNVIIKPEGYTSKKGVDY